MNATDTGMSDPYLQQFVLDNFEHVSIKPEIICPNQVGDGNGSNDDAGSTAAPTPSSGSTIAGLPEEELLRHATPDSVIMNPQIPHRLPPMSMLQQASPPPHLLTPPENQGDPYSHPSLHNYHIPLTPVMMSKSGNLLLPGTLPDTPPITSSPPLPPNAYTHLEHHHHLHQPLYPQLQPLHHLHVPGAEVVDEIFWPVQPPELQLPRQEPLDLRPHYNSESIQNWNMMQQHTSVITGPGKRIIHTDYIHHQSTLGHCQADSISPLLAPSSVSSSSASSPASLAVISNKSALIAYSNGFESQTRNLQQASPPPHLLTSPENQGDPYSHPSLHNYHIPLTPKMMSKSGNLRAGSNRNSGRGRRIDKMQPGVNRLDLDRTGKEKSSNPGEEIDDDLLLNISVRELNVKLKGTTKDKQSKTKQRRRTLKNRIYAQNCRNKRNVQKTELETAKQKLLRELQEERMKVMALQKELNMTHEELVRERQNNQHLRMEISHLMEIKNVAAARASRNTPSRSSGGATTNSSVPTSGADF